MKAHHHYFAYSFVAILGWAIGSFFPAPSSVIAAVYPAVIAARAPDDFKFIRDTHAMNWGTLRTLLRDADAKRLTDEAVRIAEQAGREIKVEHAVDQDTKDAEQQVAQAMAEPDITLPPLAPPPPITLTPTMAMPAAMPPPVSPLVAPAAAQSVPLPAPSPVGTSSAVLAASVMQTPTATTTTTITATQTVTPAGAALPQGFEAMVLLCPGMHISDAPAADSDRRIDNFSALVTVNNDKIAVDPIRTACFSSGFGSRSGKLHKGLDFYNAAGGPILAAGDGTIIEMKYRDDYGNMILIDHGNGVYTRYAHLSSFHTGLALGSTVHAGQEIGLMGNTAGYPVPMHLHYELLLGDYKNPKASFGLTPHSPLDYKAAAL
jgi:murein DD-endopeptidase MepM/ murein hydrolase activator NlpD